jgi:hypothetical protein
MNLLQLKTRTKEILDDYEGLVRFSDERLTRAINEAHIEACNRSDLIVDSRTESVCKIPLLSGVSYYAISPAIKKIKSVKFGNRILGQKVIRQIDESSAKWESKIGTPNKYALDQDTSSINLDAALETATEDDFLLLKVIRLPITTMSSDTDEPEIASHHHLGVCFGAASLLLNDSDPDAQDPGKVNRFEQTFIHWFGEPVNANAARGRLINKQLRASARFL